MGVTRSIAKTHVVVAILVLAGCIAVSSLAVTGVIVPSTEGFIREIAEKYDAYLPEIRIQNGKASIKGESPYSVDLGAKEIVIVLDTREEGVKQALNYLKPAEAGAVLTRDSLVTKNQEQIRIIPLKNMPDVTLNSLEIQAMADRYLPSVTWWMWVAVICYFCFSKTIQLLLLGMIPYFGARSYSVALSYGEALKITAFAMVPPVLLGYAIGIDALGIIGSFVVYLAAYVGLLILAVWDLVKSEREITRPGIHPS
jgi:hypothetical protein